MKNRNKLSSQERVLLALDHKETDRVPIAMICSGINEPTRSEFDEFLQKTLNIDIKSYLDSMLDIRSVAPDYIGPKLKANADFWGVKRDNILRDDGGSYNEISYYPLAEATTIDDLLSHNWPDADWFDYSVIPQQIERHNKDGNEYAIMALNCNIFETSWYMRGFQQSFMDLVLEPDFFSFILKKVTDFYCEHARRTLEAAGGKIDLIFTADDIGQQNGLLMSLDMWEEHIKPCHMRVNEVIHEYGAKVIYHTDGAVMEAVPGLIDMGIDVLQALQFDASGMDPEVLKNQYGDRLCFEGGVSVQKTLPFDSCLDVKNEVENLISTLGKSGGYILGPSHVIQTGTPLENIFAMFETAINYRK